MAGEWVLDASVAAKCLFSEPGSDGARAFVVSASSLIAPDVLFVELSSVASKKVRRGEADEQFAAAALTRAPGLLTRVMPSRPLLPRAFAYAVEHGFSAYDAVYLALAEASGARLATADGRLAARALNAELANLVALIDENSRPQAE